MNRLPPLDSQTASLLRLSNPEQNDLAQIVMASLPVPMNATLPPGLAGIATQGVDIAWWPDSQSGTARAPRRRLIFGLSDGPLPPEFRLGTPLRRRSRAPAVAVSAAIVSADYEAMLPHEIGELRFECGDRTFGLRIGSLWKNELHWWEWLRLEKLWSGPLVAAYRVGGCIETVSLKMEDVVPKRDLEPNRAIIRSPWLHRQNWLLAEAFVLCFANGVVQAACRHVNNHRFDEGREQNDLTPVIGFSVKDAPSIQQSLDGTKTEFSIGDVALNFADAAPLVSAQHPGRLRSQDGLILYHPYEGVEIEGDHAHRLRDDDFLVRASEKRFPKGIARTVRFAFSLSNVAPTISRLVVPEWWYAFSGELWPDHVLPVHDGWDQRIHQTYEIIGEEHRGRFDENFMGRSWEGETPYAEFRHFYRTGNPEHWRRAVRDAYYMADIAFDHSTETIRMHDYPLDGSIAPPLFRTNGMLFGHLETGDPYLLECAESASSHWYWMDRHAWPRYAYGRDGASIRSLIFLWDYTGKEDYRRMAREAIGRLIQCQQSDGSYRDQGSGTGIHGASHLPVKPWMANLANDPVIDYLERNPQDPELWQSLIRYGDFLMRESSHEDGSVWWPYQVAYGDAKFDPWLAFRQDPREGKLPTSRPYAHGHKARALNFLTRHTGKPAYFDAWLRFYETKWDNEPPQKGEYHVFSKTLQHLPYAQAHSWNAQWRRGALHIHPVPSQARNEMEGTILTPMGAVTLRVGRVPSKTRKPSCKWTLLEQKSEKKIRVIIGGDATKLLGAS